MNRRNQAAELMATRVCGNCAVRTEALHCERDGNATFLRASVDTADLRLEKGQILAGKYRIVGRLGRGGFAAVYSAVHLATGQQVAVKVLTVDSQDADDSVVLRFIQEAQITARLRHLNTVRVFDFGQTDRGALYMVLELLHGPTLEAVLREHANNNTGLAERDALTLVMPMLRALGEAHEAGLVHRDLKPQNIILADTGDEEPTVKVLDFGVARQVDSDLTGTGKALGTPSYMSPEQCTGGPLDGRADLYAIGVILYRMVSGRLPFHSDNVYLLLQAHSNDAPPPLREVAKVALSDGFVALVGKALAKTPADRFANAKAMRLACEGLVGGAWGGTPLQTGVVGASSVSGQQPETLALPVESADPAGVAPSDATVASPAETVVLMPARAPRADQAAAGSIVSVEASEFSARQRGSVRWALPAIGALAFVVAVDWWHSSRAICGDGRCEQRELLICPADCAHRVAGSSPVSAEAPSAPPRAAMLLPTPGAALVAAPGPATAIAAPEAAEPKAPAAVAAPKTATTGADAQRPQRARPAPTTPKPTAASEGDRLEIE